MLDRLMVFAVALSVLWHAIVGCCAHHEHRLSLETVKTAGDNCAHHCHGHLGRGSGHTSHSDEPSIQASDDKSPANCNEIACSMTADAGIRVVVLPIDSLAWNVQPVSLPECDLPNCISDGHFHSDIGFQVLGQLRRHLVLRVFLI